METPSDASVSDCGPAPVPGCADPRSWCQNVCSCQADCSTECCGWNGLNYSDRTTCGDVYPYAICQGHFRCELDCTDPSAPQCVDECTCDGSCKTMCCFQGEPMTCLAASLSADCRIGCIDAPICRHGLDCITTDADWCYDGRSPVCDCSQSCTKPCCELDFGTYTPESCAKSSWPIYACEGGYPCGELACGSPDAPRCSDVCGIDSDCELPCCDERGNNLCGSYHPLPDYCACRGDPNCFAIDCTAPAGKMCDDLCDCEEDCATECCRAVSDSGGFIYREARCTNSGRCRGGDACEPCTIK